MTNPFTCPECGSIAPPDTKTCAGCGADLQPLGAETAPIKRPVAITIIAVLNLLAGLIAMVAGTGWFVAMAETMQEATGMILVIGLVYFAVGALWIAAAVGLLKLRPWGRSLQIVLSIIGLLGIPIGTLISALILYYLFRPGVRHLFSGRNPNDFTTEERAEIAKVSSSKAAWIAVIVVILVSVFFCGMIAAIAIPNLINAMNRARQKQSVADLRSIVTAIEAYQVDHGFYPLSVTSSEDLEGLISPTYIRSLPKNDRWQNPFEIRTSEDGSSFVVICYGRDGVQGPNPGGPTTDYDADIVIENGEFTQWPKGTQHN